MSLFPGPLLDALARTPDRTAFEHGTRHVSRGELLAMTRHLASGLRHAGLGPGSSVGMVVSLSPDAFAAHLAAFALGCTVVCVRPGWTARQLAGVLGGGRVDAVVVDSATGTPEVLASAGRTRLLSLGPHLHDHERGHVGRPRLDDVRAIPDDGQPLTVRARPHDIARVNFTSGTSGRPKGCMWTYAALHPMFDPDRWPPQQARLVADFARCLVFGSWAMPVMLTFAARSLLVGGTVVIGAVDARQILAEEIARHRITGTVTPVPALHRMLDSLRHQPADLGCLRALVVTGSPAPPHLLRAATERLGPVLWQGYGQSESGMIALLTPDDLAHSPDTAMTSVGRVLPQVELSVRDPASGETVPAGEIGQIFVRHPQMMAGYWGDDAEETAEVLRDGWLDTRDLGRLDGDGLLHLTGRARDVILVNASIRYSAPIERVLAAHPDVDQAYVVGAPDERTGEAVHAFVVPSAGRTPDLDALAASVRAELGDASVPATIVALAAVPLLPGGKPDRVALRARATSGTPSDVTCSPGEG